ncbi:MAG: diguanylate cyclase [Proteobacteria bacterium]|nr:diguanylate cyclase [Pseudomonadota bacterium]
MVSVGTIFLQLLQNVSLFALVAAGYVAVSRAQLLAGPYRSAAIGLVFSAGALLVMSHGITLAPGVSIDGRSVMVATVGIFGGPIGTAITAAVVCVYRLWLGYPGGLSAVISTACTGVLGIAFAHLVRHGRIKFGFLALLVLGVAVISQGYVWFLLLNPNATLALAARAALPIYGIVPLSIALLALVLHSEDQRFALQRRLAEQTELFEAIFNSMSEGVTVADATGKIILVNPMSMALAGVGATDLSHRKWSESFGVYTPDRSTLFDTDRMPIVRAIQGEATDGVEMLVHNEINGKARLLSVSGRPLRDDADKIRGGVAVFRDITEQRDIEENLRRSEERFGLAIAGSQDGIWDYNPITGKVWYSPRFKEMLGYTDADFPNDIQFWKSLMLPEDHAASTAQFFDYEAGLIDRIDIVQRFRHKDGHIVYFSNRAAGIRGEDGKFYRLVGAATDITEQQNREHRLEELLQQVTESQAQIKDAHDEMERSSRLLRALTDAMPALVAFIDTKERYAYCNKEYHDIFEISADDIVGRTIADVVEPEIYDVVKPYIDRALRGEEVAFLRPLIAKGERRYVEQRYIPEIRVDGRVTGFYAIGWDITERHKREISLSTEAATDPLTGLFNRRAILAAMADAASGWHGAGMSGAVLYLDIDRFKQINDRLGHDAGDGVLKAFADRIRTVVRSSDKVARLGGDEFIILLTAKDGADSAKRVANALLERMAAPVLWNGTEIPVTTSIGIALINRPDLTAQQMLKEADIALYEAKSAGRATFALRKLA